MQWSNTIVLEISNIPLSNTINQVQKCIKFILKPLYIQSLPLSGTRKYRILHAYIFKKPIRKLNSKNIWNSNYIRLFLMNQFKWIYSFFNDKHFTGTFFSSFDKVFLDQVVIRDSLLVDSWTTRQNLSSVPAFLWGWELSNLRDTMKDIMMFTLILAKKPFNEKT